MRSARRRGILNRFPTFSPLDLSPILWLDAADTTTITESGGSVSQWDDKSGNSYNVTQAVAGSQPELITNSLNGLPIIRFDGTSDFMDASNTTLTGQTWFLFVVRSNATPDFPFVSTITAGLEASVTRLGSSSPPNRFVMFRNVALSSTTDSVAANTSYVISADFNGASSSLRVNQQVVASGNAGNASIAAIRLGRNPSTTYRGGDLAEVVIVSGALTADQIDSWEAYAKEKWGI